MRSCNVLCSMFGVPRVGCSDVASDWLVRHNLNCTHPFHQLQKGQIRVIVVTIEIIEKRDISSFLSISKLCCLLWQITDGIFEGRISSNLPIRCYVGIENTLELQTGDIVISVKLFQVRICSTIL